MILKARAMAAPIAHALDIDCEGGRWSKLLVDADWQVTCTDVNARSLAACRRRLPTAQCIQVSADDRTLPCADRSIRPALCIEVALVIEADWFGDEISRVLEPDGWLVGVFWNRMSWRGLAHNATRRWRRAAAQDWPWYARSYIPWRKDMQVRGFQFVCEEGFAWLPFGCQSDSALVRPAARVERALGLRALPSVSPWVAFMARKQLSRREATPVQ